MDQKIDLSGFGDEFERRTGLRLWPARWRPALIAGAGSAVGVAAFVIVLDILFAPADEKAAWTIPLLPHLTLSVLESVREDVLYRLGVMTLLVAAVRWMQKRPPSAWVVVGAAFVAQFILVATILPMPRDLPGAMFDVARFYLPGVVWGLIYWRFGFAAAMAAHIVSHLLRDPVLTAMF